MLPCSTVWTANTSMECGRVDLLPMFRAVAAQRVCLRRIADAGGDTFGNLAGAGDDPVPFLQSKVYAVQIHLTLQKKHSIVVTLSAGRPAGERFGMEKI